MRTSTEILEKHPEWVDVWGLAPIFSLVRQAGGEIRVVGGALRDALRGVPIKDIDFATTLLPEQVRVAFEAAGYKVVPTGIKHGTVTVIVNAKNYEITTLRRDLATDGRHARVGFTASWEEDAARRDFTINALYMDEEGVLYDYHKGLADVKAHRLVFIGDARLRIQEDALRILRYFRFTAALGLTEKSQIDLASFQACCDLRSLIDNLSAERIRHELMVLLSTPSPLFALQLMAEAAVLPHLLSGVTTVGFVPALLKVEAQRKVRASPFGRLLALTSDQTPLALAKRLRFSRQETKQFISLYQGYLRLKTRCDEATLLQLLYRVGGERARDCVLLVQAVGCAVSDNLYNILDVHHNTPAFPLSGRDILGLGIAPGEKVGEFLSRALSWWTMQAYRPTRDECLAFLKNLMGKRLGRKDQ